MLTGFIVTIFGILLTIGAGMLAYVVYNCVQYYQHCQNNPVSKEFWTLYWQVKKERLQKYELDQF